MENKKSRIIYKNAKKVSPADDTVAVEALEKICIKDKTDPEKEKVIRKHRV